MKVLTPENTIKQPVRVFLDDEEISDVCFYFEGPDAPFINGSGLVRLYVREDGSFVATPEGDLKSEEKEGTVRWEPR